MFDPVEIGAHRDPRRTDQNHHRGGTPPTTRGTTAARPRIVAGRLRRRDRGRTGWSRAATRAATSTDSGMPRSTRVFSCSPCPHRSRTHLRRAAGSWMSAWRLWAIFVVTAVAGSFATFFSSGDSDLGARTPHGRPLERTRRVDGRLSPPPDAPTTWCTLHAHTRRHVGRANADSKSAAIAAVRGKVLSRARSPVLASKPEGAEPRRSTCTRAHSSQPQRSQTPQMCTATFHPRTRWKCAGQHEAPGHPRPRCPRCPRPRRM